MADYPAWICIDCGRKWGRRQPTHEITIHLGDTCGICGEEKPTTEPRDFSHLKDGWQEAVRKRKG